MFPNDLLPLLENLVSQPHVILPEQFWLVFPKQSLIFELPQTTLKFFSEIRVDEDGFINDDLDLFLLEGFLVFVQGDVANLRL